MVQALQQKYANLRQQKQVNHGYPQNTNGQVDQGFVPPNAMGGELNLPELHIIVQEQCNLTPLFHRYCKSVI